MVFDLYLLSDTLFKIYSSGQIFYNLGHCSGPMYGKYFRPTARTLIVFLLFPKRTVVHILYGFNFKKKYTLAVKNRGVTLWYQSFGLDFHGVVSRVS